MRLTIPIGAGIALAGTAAVAVAVIATRADRTPRLRADDARIVAEGKVVYDQYCAICHGANLEGQPDWRRRAADGLLPAPPHDETGHTWHHDDETLFNITKYGVQMYAGEDYRSAMPPFAPVLGDGEIIAALSYIKSAWPDDIRQSQSRQNR